MIGSLINFLNNWGLSWLRSLVIVIMDLCRNMNWISFILLLLFILNIIFYDICLNFLGVLYGFDYECNINVLKKLNI